MAPERAAKRARIESESVPKLTTLCLQYLARHVRQLQSLEGPSVGNCVCAGLTRCDPRLC